MDIVDLNEDQPNEEGKSYLFRVWYSKEISPDHLHFGRDSEPGRGVGELYTGKRGRLQISLGVCGPGEAVGRLTRSRASM